MEYSILSTIKATNGDHVFCRITVVRDAKGCSNRKSGTTADIDRGISWAARNHWRRRIGHGDQLTHSGLVAAFVIECPSSSVCAISAALGRNNTVLGGVHCDFAIAIVIRREWSRIGHFSRHCTVRAAGGVGSTGFVVSAMVMVCDTEAVLPHLSVKVQVRKMITLRQPVAGGATLSTGLAMILYPQLSVAVRSVFAGMLPTHCTVTSARAAGTVGAVLSARVIV